MLSAALLLLYVIVSTAGLTRIKAAAQVLSLEFAVGLVLYGAGFIIWLTLLRRMPLSAAFPIAASSLVIATFMSGHFFLGEKIDPAHWLGGAFIVAGIVLIGWRSATT